jgi:hypothetical protein
MQGAVRSEAAKLFMNIGQLAYTFLCVCIWLQACPQSWLHAWPDGGCAMFTAMHDCLTGNNMHACMCLCLQACRQACASCLA